MREALLITCDFSGSVQCRVASSHRQAQERPLLQTRTADGLPSILKASKYSAGDLRLVFFGDRALTIFNVEDFLSNSPPRDSLVPPLGFQGPFCEPVFHQPSPRGLPTTPVNVDFGETSNILLTASETEGVALRDLRGCKCCGLLDLVFQKPDVIQKQWSTVDTVGEWSRALRYACFAPNFRDIAVLTDSHLYVWDRRYEAVPRSQIDVPLGLDDKCHQVHIARQRHDDTLWPCWITTRGGSLFLFDFDGMPSESVAMGEDASLNLSVSNFRSYLKLPEGAKLSSALVHPFHHEKLITGSSSGLINIWPVDQLAATDTHDDIYIEPPTLNGHSKWVWSLDVTRDGELLVSASSDGTVKAWRLASGTEVSTLVSSPESTRSNLQRGFLHCVLLD